MQINKFIKLFEKKENCCGCTACVMVCPVEAIHLQEDEEGFQYPQVDNDKCIKCMKCQSVCNFKGRQKQKSG